MSRSGTSVISATSACSANSHVFSRTMATNQSRKCGAASITPPPTKYVSGSVNLAASENTRPIAIACWRKIASAISSPCSPRSEEHTSELQSRENLVCRLLLEKKKKNIYIPFIYKKKKKKKTR